ncbi:MULTISPECIES: SGNH/GDSL hydrolase family protein [Sphingobacterium]|uniref:SGNH/GDSL hydrolase family protein n=1 Tax=Sphingobacterium TaxID=28453 RepID=UPI0013DB47EE|nr:MULTISPECIES: SGNH/GDSL hydrolase family protein [unclassified Sphingobacterium]
MMITNKDYILRYCLYIFSFVLFWNNAQAQYTRIASDVVMGRVEEVRKSSTLGRLPERLKGNVRKPVWSLGTNTAGSYVDFRTSSDTIYVRYKVESGLNMPHMPSTGVSGVDLYYQDKSSKSWGWAFGNYSFKDTITYVFANLGKSNDGTYRLYLPLYNSLQWIEIAGNKSNSIKFANSPNKKPIIVYGTSIAQGACATRPGLAWTNILGRSITNPVINLGFSGNGRLEQPILDLITQENAAAFILDCIPNLALTAERTASDLEALLSNAVRTIRKKHPEIPIILAAHSSANTPGFLNIHTMQEYRNSSKVAKTTYGTLTKEGIKHLYWVSEHELGLDINSTVDYAHPNDLGMMKIAEAYQRLLLKIL